MDALCTTRVALCNHRAVARPSPQTDRVVALVELLSDHPGEGFTLAEVTRRLGVNKSTCHSILTTLLEAGWLLRDPNRKTYRLGPSLVNVARSAATGFPALQFARPEMVTISRELGAHCVALEVGEDHVTVVDQVRDVRAVGAPLQYGDIPLRPPFGAAAVAWAGPARAERWLAHAAPDARDGYRRALAAIRRRGFVVEAPNARLHDMVAHLGAAGLPLAELVDELAPQLDEGALPARLEPARRYVVSSVNAPVFDSDGEVVLILAVLGLPGVLTGREVKAVGQRVMTSTTALTAAISPKEPSISSASRSPR
jgi:DNA-binding IclR family transcriptional regulator